LSQEAVDRGSTDFEPAGDLGFTAALLVQLSRFDGFVNNRWRAAESFALLACVHQPGADTLAKDLAFELGEHREQSGHGVACGRRQVEVLR
jgi:hypothetical protein